MNRGIEELCEHEAINAVEALAQKFGWQYAVLTRGDVEDANWSKFGREDYLTDDEWKKIRRSVAWRKLGDGLLEVAENRIPDILRTVLDL